MEASPEFAAAATLESTLESHEESTAAEAASLPFLGRWQRLVSTTNWEKGRIICEWRETLIAADAPLTAYSDEAWAERVGGVTSQHVGRLRRVFSRFASTHESFTGLYWSHFQAAVDWDDAEMWLEGALQNDWSVSQMRQERATTLGGVADASLQTADAPFDEDEAGFVEMGDEPVSVVRSASQTRDAKHDDEQSDPDDGTDEEATTEDAIRDREPTSPAAVVQPFANLPELPDDLQQAFDQFKLAILRHRREQWRDVSAGDVAQALDGLKTLTLSPLEA